MNTLINDLTNTILKFIKASDALLLGIDIPDCQPYLNLVNRKDRKQLARQQNNICWINQYRNTNKRKKVHKILLFAKDTVKKLFYIGCNGDVQGFRKHTNYQMYQLISFIEGLAHNQHFELFEKFANRISIDLLTNAVPYFAKANMRVWLLLGFTDEDYIIAKMDEWKIQPNVDTLGIICYKNRLKVLEYNLKYCNNDINNVGPYTIGYLYECGSLSLLDSFTGQVREKELEPVIVRFCLGSDIEALNYISRFVDRHTFHSCLAFLDYSKEVEDYRHDVFEKMYSGIFNLPQKYDQLDINYYFNWQTFELLKPFILQKKWFDRGLIIMMMSKYELAKPITIITQLIVDCVQNNNIAILRELCVILINNDRLKFLRDTLTNGEFKNSSFLLSLSNYLTMTPKQLRIKYRHDTGLKHLSGMKRLQLLVKFIEMTF